MDGVDNYTRAGYSWKQFNASKGEMKLDGTLKNDVYGKSDHVTPMNITYKIWKRTS